MKKYTKEEIKSLKFYNANTAGTRYKIKLDDVTIVVDNHEGIGAAQHTKEIFYKGFVSEISFKSLISLCSAADLVPKESFDIKDSIKDSISVANPSIYLDIDNFISQSKGYATVLDFDGLSTAFAMNSLGCEKIPVQFILVGYKADNVKGERFFYDWLNRGVTNLNKTKAVANVFERLIFG